MTDLIFKKNKLGNIEFVGDFESLYASDDDPWGQSADGDNASMNEFYVQSRSVLCRGLGKVIDSFCVNSEKITICEVGCGTGFLTNLIQSNLPSAYVWGVDVSASAVVKAKSNFPNIEFEHLDILLNKIERKAQVLLLSNIIWYVIHDMSSLMKNILHSLDWNSGSCYLVIQNALFKNNQKYGAELVSSIGTLTDLFINSIPNYITINSVHSEFHRSTKMYHDFGLVCIQLNRDKI